MPAVSPPEHPHPLSLRGAQRRGDPQTASVAIAARKAFSHKSPQSPLLSTLTPCHCEERSDVAIPYPPRSPLSPPVLQPQPLDRPKAEGNQFPAPTAVTDLPTAGSCSQ